MDGPIIASGIFPSFKFSSIQYGKEVVHKIKVTGPIDLEKRLPLYHKTLAVNPSDKYFCILDNSEEYENNFSYPDIVALDNLLIAAGIRCFYGATITKDPAYSNLVKLANHNAKASKLEGELLATGDPAEAERFILKWVNSTGG